MRQDYSGLFGKHTLKSPVELFIHEPTRFDIPVQCLHDEGVIGSRNKVTVMLHGSIFVSLKADFHSAENVARSTFYARFLLKCVH